MAVNRGKAFEHIIREAFENETDVVVYRIPDQMSGMYGSKNPCDMFVYAVPTLFALELKSVHGNTLPFTNISEYQWQQMLKMSKVTGVVAGVICWYVDRDRTIFIPIQFLEMLKQNGAKSIRFDADDIHISDIVGKKKKVFWEYDMSKFFEEWR